MVKEKQVKGNNADTATEFATDIKKCPNCGSDYVYNPDKYCLECLHCKSSQSIEGKPASEISFYELPLETDADWAVGINFYRCNNCGAKTMLDGYEISPKCSFCGATNIVEIQELPGVKPNGVLPFSRNQSEAAEFSQKWIKKQLFAPTKLKKHFKTEGIKGVYIPVFTFDSKVSSIYKARLGRHRTRTVTRNGKTYTETYTEWFNVKGTIDKIIDDLLVEACDRITQKEVEKLLPFDTYNSVEYNKSYLAGFTSLRYNQGINQSWELAKDLIDNQIKKDIIKKYRANEVDYINLTTFHSHTSYKYLFVPVWMCHYEYKNKRYGYMVNGRTGKITGKIPLSPIKVTGAVLFIVMLVVFFISFFYHLGNK